jgi:hypothetical protein
VGASAAAAPAPTPGEGFFRFAPQTEGAIGVSGPFYNHLLGLRLDRCVTWNTCIGAYGAYANVKGRSGRESNVLVAVQLEHRRPLGRWWYVPLRASTGYVPKNGPVMRLSAGIGVRSDNVDVTLDLLAPMLWVTGNETVVSMDVAADVAVRF